MYGCGLGGWVEDVTSILKTGVETYRTATAPRFPAATTFPEYPYYPSTTEQGGVVYVPGAPSGTGDTGWLLPVLGIGVLTLLMFRRKR